MTSKKTASPPEADRMDTAPEPHASAAPPHPLPQTGGSYILTADGRLVLEDAPDDSEKEA